MGNDILELLIKATVASDGGLDKINAAIQQIGKNSGLSGQALANLQSRVSSEFQKMTAAGLNFNQQIAAMAKSGDQFGKGVAASAKEIQTQFNQAAQAAKNVQTQVNATKQALGGIQGATTNPFGALTNSATSFAATLGPLGLAIGGVATAVTLGAKAMFDLVDSQGRAAQQTVNMATQMGITAGAMKKLQVEGELIGVSFQTMQMASRQLANALEDPVGAGKRASQALKDLGVSTQTLSGGLRGEGEVFQDVIERLAGMTDHTKQVEEATRLFGARGSASLQLVIDRYKDLDATARSLGYGDTTELQEHLAKGEEKINAMRAAWDLFMASFAEKVEPGVTAAITALTNLLSQPANRDHQRVMGAWAVDVKPLTDGYTPKGFDVSKNSPWADVVGNIDTATDVDRGNAMGKNFMDAFYNSQDGRRAKLSDLETQLKTALANVSQQGAGTVAKKGFEDQATNLQAQIDAIKAQEKAEKEYETTRKRVEELDNRANVSGLTGLQKLEEERQNSLKTLGTTAEFIRRINADYDKMSAQEKKNEADKLAKLDRSLNSAALREDSNRQGRLAQKDGGGDDPEAAYRARIALAQQLFQDSTREAETLAEKDKIAQQYYNTAKAAEADLTEEKRKQLNVAEKIRFEESLRIIQINQEANRSSANRAGRSRSSALQLAGLDPTASDANDKIAELITSKNQQQAEYDSLLAQLGNGADKEKDRSEIRLKQLELVRKTEQQILDTREQAEEKIAELRQKELDSYKKQADQIFDALRTPGSQGIRSFFNAQGTDLARTLFSNATAPALQFFGQSTAKLIGGQTTTDAQGNTTRTALGSLLKDTIFDTAKSGKTPQIVAIDANTQALNRLTGSLTGKSIGGTPAPAPDPNSITGVIAQEATGGIGAIGGGSSAVASVAGSQLAALASEGNAAGVGQFGISAPIGAGSLFSLLNPNIAAPGATAQQNGLSQFVTGASKGIGNWNEIFTGQGPNQVDQLTGETIPTYVSPEQQAGAAIGTGAVLAGGTLTAVQSFEKGGASGVLGGIGAAAGTAALLDPDPTSKAVLAATATVAELVKSILPDPKAVREASISNQIAYEQYLAPAAMSRTLSDSGGFEQVNDKYGLPSSTSYTSVAKSEPYKYLASQLQTPGSLYQNWSYEMGTVTEPYQTPGAIPTYANPSGNQAAPIIINNHISAVDQASFNSFGPKLASSLQQQVLEGHPVAAALQRAILGA